MPTANEARRGSSWSLTTEVIYSSSRAAGPPARVHLRPALRHTEAVQGLRPKQRGSRSSRRRALGTSALLAVLLVCPACSDAACACPGIPAPSPPSVFVHADALLQKHSNAQAKVCATGCTTITAKNGEGSVGQQLVIENANETTPIHLVATVEIPHQKSTRSDLVVHLTKSQASNDPTSVTHQTDVHLDSSGRLEEGRA